ncbi:hypothetical protein HWV62_22469 [Athelia sp. TMB]|nr:hypothetical protein HWV62_22469 [Athelia sp. TMB]
MARAAYSPPSMRSWVSQTNPEPLQADIATERYRRRFAVSRDQREFPAVAGQNFLHPHFLLNSEERRWAWHEGICDIQDAVTGMGRLADVVHIGFTLRPEWDPSKALNVDDIEVTTIVSRQVEQMEGWKEIVARLADVVRREIGVPHILQFRTKLSQVTPPPGYTIDDITRGSIYTPLRVAPGTQSFVPVPQPAPRPAAPDTTPSRPATMAQQTQQNSVISATAASSIPGPSSQTRQNSILPTDTTTAAITPHRGGSFRRIRRDSSWSDDEDTVIAGTPSIEPRSSRRIQHDSSSSDAGTASTSAPRASTSAAAAAHRARRPSQRVRALSGHARGRNHLSGGTGLEDRPFVRAAASSLPSEPIVISTSDEDSSDEANPFAADNLQHTVPAQSRPGWLRTPLGTPPDRPPIGRQGSRNQHPIQPPPAYYTHPSINMFGFPEPVNQFLRDSGHTNARTLCMIDATRNCGISCWRARFQEAGLSPSQAKELQDLLFTSLPSELQGALEAASHSEEDEDFYWRGLEDSSDGL